MALDCTGTNKSNGQPCRKKGINGTARCMHHTIQDTDAAHVPTSNAGSLILPVGIGKALTFLPSFKAEKVAAAKPESFGQATESQEEEKTADNPYKDWSQHEIYTFVLNKTNGRVKLNPRLPVEVLSARAVEALA